VRKDLLRQVTLERVLPSCAPKEPTFRSCANGRPLAVNVDSCNLCEIGSLLAAGFLRYTDWAYWSVMTAEPSWLGERHWWKIDNDDPERREQKMLDELVVNADVLHLNSYRTWEFLGRCADAMKGRTRVVMHHHAMNLREKPQIAWEERDAGWNVLVSTPDLLMHVPWATWLPSPIDVEELDANYPVWDDEEDRFIVGHAFTVAANKGTNDFARVMVQCANADNSINFLPWNGIAKRQSLWLMSQCDAYFASYPYGPGVAAYEAMAMEIPVLCGCSEEELKWQCKALGVKTAADLPWIYVTPETTGEWIMRLRENPELSRQWGRQGRLYVEEYHAVPRVVDRLLDIYEGTAPCREVLTSA